MPQFVCDLCGEGFEQRSRYERHMASSHPPRAPSASDVEKALRGIDFPKRRKELVAHAAGRLPPDSAILGLIRALPNREYRDAAEVGIALGDVKRPDRRPPGRSTSGGSPSRRGGRAASRAAVSAATIARALGGIDFPKSKPGLLRQVDRNKERVAVPRDVKKVLAKIPERPYASMADVEKEVGKIL